MKKKVLVWFVATLFASIVLFVGVAWAQDEEARKHLLHELGGPFFVSRDKAASKN